MVAPPISEYMIFNRAPARGRVTDTWLIFNKRSKARLGRIAWHGAWRQYVFFPEPETIFNTGCMTEIQQLIADLMAERRQ